LIEKYTFELVKDIDVNEEEIKEYYSQKKRDFLRQERVKVSQILVRTEEKAIEVMEKMKDPSEENFRKMAKEVSVGLEASKGGEMGVFEMGQLPFEMEKVIFSLKEGDMSPVVESTYGYHIFRLDKRYEPELISVKEAAPEIQKILLQQKIQMRISEHLAELKKNIVWSSYPQNLSFPYKEDNT
jgi:parvulin-like peptidyl-prolyl isomerase